MMTFSLKKIVVEISLATQDTFIFSDYPISVRVDKVGLPDKNKAHIILYGLNLEIMEKLTTISSKSLINQLHRVKISAGDDQSLTQKYTGEISLAYADFNSAPNVSFHIRAMTGFIPSLMPRPAMSRRGIFPTALLLAELALTSGYLYKNEGMSTFIENPYFTGSALEQILQIAQSQALEIILDDNEVIAITQGMARLLSPIEISKHSGLIHYPSFTGEGISARSTFNPKLCYAGLINLDSIVPKSSGIWKISKLSHNLSANIPSKPVWESSFEAVSLF